MKYKWRASSQGKITSQRVFFSAFIACFLALLLFAGFVLYEQINKIDYNPEEQTTSALVTNTAKSSNQVFESPYFTFRANNSWKKDDAVSSDNVYIYRSTQSGQLEQLLTIYINKSPAELDATYVLPVTQNGASLRVGDLSEHCGKQSNYSRQLGVISVAGVSMRCFGDDTRFNVVAGLVNGSTEMRLQRPNGEFATYVVYYSNSTASPNAEQLKDIMRSFTIR